MAAIRSSTGPGPSRESVGCLASALIRPSLSARAALTFVPPRSTLANKALMDPSPGPSPLQKGRGRLFGRAERDPRLVKARARAQSSPSPLRKGRGPGRGVRSTASLRLNENCYSFFSTTEGFQNVPRNAESAFPPFQPFAECGVLDLDANRAPVTRFH